MTTLMWWVAFGIVAAIITLIARWYNGLDFMLHEWWLLAIVILLGPVSMALIILVNCRELDFSFQNKILIKGRQKKDKP